MGIQGKEFLSLLPPTGTIFANPSFCYFSSRATVVSLSFNLASRCRPDTLDPAILRNGRLGEHFYVGLPSAEERGLILKTLARKKPIDPEVDLSAIARMEACENLSGSDLATLVCTSFVAQI